MTSDDRSWPFSFANLCDFLNLTIEPVRKQLLGAMLPAVMAEKTTAPETLLEKAA